MMCGHNLGVDQFCTSCEVPLFESWQNASLWLYFKVLFTLCIFLQFTLFICQIQQQAFKKH